MTTEVSEVRIPAPELRGANFALGANRDPEVCIEGAGGTGKTFAVLYKIHTLLLSYPGAQALVARKSNTDLAGSAMVTYRDDVLHPEEGVYYFGGNRVKPAGFVYPNGSFLAINGLDKPSKLKSTAYDIAYINEATECTVEDVETMRMRMRKGIMPYQQIILDCNPDASTHWLNQRMNDGLTTRLVSKHEDNPRYFDLHTRDWTEDGRRYIFEILGGLTGVRLARYRYGLWAAAEGTVYEDSWSRAHNLVARRDIPRDWPRYLAIDFGYTNPFVCLWCAVDPDGRLYIYRYIYKTKTLVEEHAREIAIASGWFNLLPTNHPRYQNRPAQDADPLPRDIICDHDAEGRATLEAHLGLDTTPAKKTISDGLQAVTARLRPAGDGIPRLLLLQNSVVERDGELARLKLPTTGEEEVEMYVWDTRQGKKKGEEPVDANNHFCLVAGTLVTTDHGDVPIEQIQTGDRVLTRNGYQRVKAAGMTERMVEVYTAHFSNGATLTGTGNHPVYVEKQGYTPLRAMRYGDIIMTIEQVYERLSVCHRETRGKQKSSSIRRFPSEDIQKHSIGQREITIKPMLGTQKKVFDTFMLRYGKTLTGLFQRVSTFITGTAIHLITPWKILSASQKMSIMPGTSGINIPPALNPCVKTSCQRHGLLPRNGISQKRGGHGIKSLAVWPMSKPNIKHTRASIAEMSFNHGIWGKPVMFASVPTTAKLMLAMSQALIMSNALVSSAEGCLSGTNMQRKSSAQKSAPYNTAIQTQDRRHCNALFATHPLPWVNQLIENAAQEDVLIHYAVSVEKENAHRDVYNLTVETDTVGEYFANGILVHNCDAMRYLAAYFDLTTHGVSYYTDIWK